jgi:hypothetical protein
MKIFHISMQISYQKVISHPYVYSDVINKRVQISQLKSETLLQIQAKRLRQGIHIVSNVVNACVKITLRREYDSIQTLT